MGPLTIIHLMPGDDVRRWVEAANLTTDRPSAVDDIQHSLERKPGQLRSIAFVDGQPVGTACAVPDTLRGNGTMQASLRVVANRRRSGIGTALYEDMVCWMKQAGGRYFEVTVRDNDPAALEFWTRRHCREVERDVVVAIDVASFVDATTPASGVEVASLAQRPDLLRGVYDVGAATWSDIPEHEPRRIIGFDEWRGIIEADDESRPEAIFAAIVDGEVAGYAHLLLPPEAPSVGYHNFTGVRREHRGRGIARSLKLHVIEWARCNGRSTLMTGNHEDNAPMRYINEALGYRRLYAQVTMRGEIG